MDGFPFWELTLSGIIVSWPGIAVSVWLAVRHVKKHVNAATSAQTANIAVITSTQTADIQGMTDSQTRVLLTRRWWHRLRRRT